MTYDPITAEARGYAGVNLILSRGYAFPQAPAGFDSYLASEAYKHRFGDVALVLQMWVGLDQATALSIMNELGEGGHRDLIAMMGPGDAVSITVGTAPGLSPEELAARAHMEALAAQQEEANG